MFGMSKDPPAPKRKPKASAAKVPPAAATPEVEEAMVDLSVPLTPAQNAKLQKLGGVKWILAQLEKAKPGSA